VRVMPGPVAPHMMLDATDPKPSTASPPTTCGACQLPLVLAIDEPFGRCDNPACTGRKRSRILHLIGARGVALTSLNARTAESLLGSGTLPLIELFALDPVAVEKAQPGAGEAFRAEREKVRTLALWRALYLCGIPEVGERVARLVAAHFDSPEALLGRNAAAIAEIPDIPPESIGPLASWIGMQGAPFFTRLAELGVTILGDSDAYAAPLGGKRVVLAGKLEKLSIEQAVDEIERRGGIVEPRVTRRTDLLVAGAGAAEAATNAEAYGVMVVEEAAFFGLLRLST